MSDRYVSEMQDFLRNLGQPVQEDAEVTVLPPPKGEMMSVVVLERVKQDVTPPYCIHGYATCIRCHEPVWLGHETEQVVKRGQAYPICMECAASDLPRNQGPVMRLNDHLRKDGPHS